MKKLTQQELKDILYGAAILGTGGGGELDEGFGLIDDALAKGKEFILVDLNEAPDDALVCTPYMLGAVSALPEEEEQQYNRRLPRADEPSILIAYRRFQEYLGREFYGTISCELGGSNTAISFYAAAMNGHYIIDADPAGRAVPEITHSTYYIHGLPASPIMMANEFGECFTCENVVDDMRAESVVRALARVSRNDIAAIDHALELREIRHAVITGAITMAMNMGRVWREACASSSDVAQAIADVGKGFVGFRGTIGENDWKTENGFTIGNINIDGSGSFVGETYRIWLKNENLVGWRNGTVHTTIPDMICLIDMDTNLPITNPNYHSDQNVAVVILPAPDAFTSTKGLASFGPAYVGLDQPYEPSVPKWASTNA